MELLDLGGTWMLKAVSWKPMFQFGQWFWISPTQSDRMLFIIMGNCTKGQKKQDPALQQDSIHKHKLKNGEIQMLELMYKDLASRSIDNKLTREVFDTFFHLNGLWGQEMFEFFDKNHQGQIDFQAFIESIEWMVKGSFEERSKLLFQFYDVDKTGGISYKELLRMLYSYSKEDLQEMITEEKFLKTMDNYQLTQYFGPEKILDDKIIVEEEEESQKSQIERKQSEYMPTSAEFIQMQKSFAEEFESRKKKEGKFVLPKNGVSLKQVQLNGNGNMSKQQQRRKDKLKQTRDAYKRGGSLVDTPTYIRSKNIKLTNNVASLVKKYAAYIFNQLKLDKNKDEIKFEQFLQIIKNHQKIFNIYFEGFHSYLWLLDNDMTPLYTTMTPWIEDECEEVYKNQRNYRYLKYIKTTILVFKSVKSKVPIEVKNMEGLLVEPKQSDYGYGIVIKHRDGIYPEKQYYFKDEASQSEWIRFLAEFKANSIYNQYLIMQKIGTGNFSSVYRGVEKTPQKRQVAIKVIEKFKLTLNQKQVIKFECGILELCHHPNIIKFCKQYTTKSNIYIVTELLTEGDLFEYTKKSTFLEEYESAIIFKQLCQAIRYLNQDLGLIHRDLKPENVMIVTNKEKNLIQRVKIIDFGFAVYKSNLKNLGVKEKFAGTPGFVAPQVFKGEDYDEGVDMFSLGIILYFILSGHLPFYSPIYEQIVEQTKQCNINYKNAHWMNISDDAKDLLSKILTFKQERINTKDALEHPWLKDIEKLKEYNGRNKKNRYI